MTLVPGVCVVIKRVVKGGDPRPQKQQLPERTNAKVPTLELAQKEAKRRNARNFGGRIVGFWEVRQEGAAFVIVWVDLR
jgi:hypothetical protein